MDNYRRLAGEAGVVVLFSTQDESDFQVSDHGYTIASGKTNRRF
jgi:hypothetical protein